MPARRPEYPVEQPDRRKRSRSRADYSTRQKDPRYICDFPVTITVGKGKNEKTYEGMARNVSSGGIRLVVKDLPKTETRLKVSFEPPEGAMPEEYIHSKFETEGEVRYRDDSTNELGVEFTESLAQRLARGTWRNMRYMAFGVLALALVWILFIKYNNLYFFWFDVPVFLYSLLVGGYLVSRFLFAAFYTASKPLPELPSATVIIPVRNEEDYIERTITQLMECSYPAEKLQAIVVNDGSTDSTAAAIERARAEYPELILINFERSRGKRDALAAGARIATGDVIVFMDSDSFLKPDALKNLMNRFSDPEVAAVTGHCEVENEWTNTLTRMQSVRYYIAFRIMKAAESVFDAVTCLSGPLSAYRRKVLFEVIDEWTSQTFLGQPATFGDDRSLTNSLLQRRYRVVYEATARVTTIVPDRYGVFLRQQARWKRSWFRESLRAVTFMWKKQPLMALSFYLGFLLPLVAPFIVIRAMVYVPIMEHALPLQYMTGILAMSALMSSTYLFEKRSRLWLYGVVFCFFYMFVLVWQLPWAVLTFARRDWGTREQARVVAAT